MHSAVVSTFHAWPSLDYAVTRRYVGRVEAARQSALGFELGGLVAKIHVDEGDPVLAGEALASLDTERLLSRRRELEAVRDEARANLDLARLTDARVRRMVSDDAISAQRGDDTRKAVEARRAALARTEAQLARIDVDLEKAVLRAPFSGTIAERQRDEGAVVGVGQPIVTVLETDRLEVRVGVAAAALGDLELQQSLEVEIAGRRIPVRVRTLRPDRDRGTRTVDVLLALEPGDTSARSGDLAELLVEQTVDERGFWLPTSALAEGVRGLWTCYVAVALPEAERLPGGSTHRLERRQLQILHADANEVFVTGFLEIGDQVVGDGVHRLVPGQVVRVDIFRTSRKEARS